MKAWYFSRSDRRLAYGDGRYISPGITHTVNCKPVLCKSGLHASKDIMDALFYSPGKILWQVELGGEIVEGDDKVSATERTYLWGVDASQCVMECARKFALDAAHMWKAPQGAVRFLETGDETLRQRALLCASDAYRTYTGVNYLSVDREKSLAAWAATLLAQGDENFEKSIRISRAAAACGLVDRDSICYEEALEIVKFEQSKKLLDMVNKLPRLS